MPTIVFGTPEAAAISKADKQIFDCENIAGDLRALEYQDLRKARRQLLSDLRWAKVIYDQGEIERLEAMLDYIEQEMKTTPSVEEEQHALQQWNEWATGNPAAVKVYAPGIILFSKR
jgi:hypothetical protein